MHYENLQIETLYSPRKVHVALKDWDRAKETVKGQKSSAM